MDDYDEALSLWDDPIDLPPDLVNEKEQAKRLFLEYESTTLPDRAEVKEKTNSQRQSIMEKWEMFARDYLEIDPNQVWYDLCDELEPAANPIQSFLESYARQSMERRICLGPKEYEWTPTVKTAVTMMEVWKNLLSCADATVLQNKRRQDHKNKMRWRLAFTEGEAKGKRRGNDLVYRISLWIKEDLVKKLGLARTQTFTKVATTAADITLYLDTLWRRADDIRCSPSKRVAFHAVMLLSCIGGFRPATLLQLLFRQVELSVVRDPMDASKTQLVAKITIYQNKQESNKIGRKQDDVVSFSITIVPWPLLCIASLIAMTAIHKHAFETPFSSLEDILSRPILENTDCVVLRWRPELLDEPMFGIQYHTFFELWYKVLLVVGLPDPPRPYSMRVGAGGNLHRCLEPHLSNYILSHTENVFQGSYQPVHVTENLPRLAFARVLEFDAHERLYGLLENASFRRDEGAPIYPKEEDLSQWEQRRDIRGLRAKYQYVRAHSNADDPQAKRIAAQIQFIRDRLSDLQVAEDRRQYFEVAGRLRAAGQPIPHELKRGNVLHRKQYYGPISDAATAIGRFLHQKNHSVASPGAFIEMGLAYLENLPDVVKTVAAKHAPTMQTPSGTPPIKPDAEALDDPEDPDDPDVRPRCLFGCGFFSNRGNLTRHVQNMHIVRRRNFDRPFNCPECTQHGLQAAVIVGPSAWSSHVERVHGALHAPYIPSDHQLALLEKLHARKQRVKPERLDCMLCGLPVCIGQAYSRHTNRRHSSKNVFRQEIECGACERSGSRLEAPIIGYSSWMDHARTCHGRDGKTGRRLA
ncbi:hypothetical protein CPLU01_15711 [Colletotrichum plurivorum]|uniref:C2H2-type domain-containing protein n=1 Tax=Colletotrichum plurivorum TaxID=2175906 RepID=A0A8H6MTX9_9PEZI|nr:hypothetical protein CPLU01_15711 [Colletotrichum plurivorum]